MLKCEDPNTPCIELSGSKIWSEQPCCYSPTVKHGAAAPSWCAWCCKEVGFQVSQEGES